MVLYVCLSRLVPTAPHPSIAAPQATLRFSMWPACVLRELYELDVTHNYCEKVLLESACCLRYGVGLVIVSSELADMLHIGLAYIRLTTLSL